MKERFLSKEHDAKSSDEPKDVIQNNVGRVIVNPATDQVKAPIDQEGKGESIHGITGTSYGVMTGGNVVTDEYDEEPESF